MHACMRAGLSVCVCVSECMGICARVLAWVLASVRGCMAVVEKVTYRRLNTHTHITKIHHISSEHPPTQLPPNLHLEFAQEFACLLHASLLSNGGKVGRGKNGPQLNPKDGKMIKQVKHNTSKAVRGMDLQVCPQQTPTG